MGCKLFIDMNFYLFPFHYFLSLGVPINILFVFPPKIVTFRFLKEYVNKSCFFSCGTSFIDCHLYRGKQIKGMLVYCNILLYDASVKENSVSALSVGNLLFFPSN
jgi:hypothetical protein